MYEKDCSIYEDRFFGCRAYGLWSKAYYDKLAALDRQARANLYQQWQNLGVSLPANVIDFEVPYCLNVKTDQHAVINDTILLSISESIKALSLRFSHLHESFSQNYFSDLSFLLSSLVFGHTEAVKIKFNIVSGMINTGSRSISMAV